MLNKFVFNSAIPPSDISRENAVRYSLKLLDDNGESMSEDVVGGAVDFKPDAAILASEQMDYWNIRDQGARGTCNGFAAVAAEELRRFSVPTGGIDVPPLSEEYLYSKARGQTGSLAEFGIDPEKLEEFERTGGTFLFQIRDALVLHGVASEADAPYDDDAAVNHFETQFSPEVAQDAIKRRVPLADLLHNITGPKVGLNRSWHTKLRVSPSTLFAHCLRKDCPVMASFAILNEGGYVWTGQTAKVRGHVKYPPDAIVAKKSPVAGHTVCLVGFVPKEGANPGDDHQGWFLFRNSYGTKLFGHDADNFPDQPNYKLPGFGFISTFDVDRFCWEYLCRRPDGVELLDLNLQTE